MLHSVTTNNAAMVALRSLDATTGALNGAQKRIATGLRVNDAKDDGPAFAVAQSVRADVAGLAAANEQLAGVKGILDTTLAALGKVSEAMVQIRETLTRLADTGRKLEQLQQYRSQYAALRVQIQRFIADSTYNGRTLLSTIGPSGGNLTPTRNENGATYAIAAVDGAATLVIRPATLGTQGAWAALADDGDFAKVERAVNDALNTFGNHSRHIDAQIAYNRNRIDSIQAGLGALIDADLAKKSARVQSLQIRQQLGTQALSIANQAPQMLLGLFR